MSFPPVKSIEAIVIMWKFQNIQDLLWICSLVIHRPVIALNPGSARMRRYVKKQLHVYRFAFSSLWVRLCRLKKEKRWYYKLCKLTTQNAHIRYSNMHEVLVLVEQHALGTANVLIKPITVELTTLDPVRCGVIRGTGNVIEETIGQKIT